MKPETLSMNGRILHYRENRDVLTAEVLIPEDLVYFQGHFPGSPILPGVAQIKIVITLLERYVRKNIALEALHKTKFSTPVHPGDTLRVRLAIQEKNCAKWQIDVKNKTASRGKLLFRIE